VQASLTRPEHPALPPSVEAQLRSLLGTSGRGMRAASCG
jgi:hypothetical protein